MLLMFSTFHAKNKMKFSVVLLLILAIQATFFFGKYECKVVQFIFGDSLSDVGNNNYFSKSLAKASLPYYGIDFGSGMPNGRFTNGRTVADIIGDAIGLPRPPAFMDPTLTEDTILDNGVNYASGGGGILNETGGLFIQRLSFYRQIELFQGTQDLIRAKIGDVEAEKFFRQASYVVALGSNDFINNYLMPVYRDSWSYNDETFIQYLMDTLQDQLKVLHSLGARQLVFFGLGPMGCIPLQRYLSTSGSGDCQEKTNKLAQNFNLAASQMVDDLSNKLPNATFKFGDAYDVVSDVIANPSNYGFSNSDSPCCAFGKIRPALTCIPVSTLCKDRSKYVFWDEYHPSDSGNAIIAGALLKKFGFFTGNSTASPPSPAAMPPSPAAMPPSPAAMPPSDSR